MKASGPSIGLLAAALLAALCMPLAASGSGEKTTGKRLAIAYIRPTADLYYASGFDGARMAAVKMNVDLQGSLSDLKADQELADVQGAISHGVDGIILFPVSALSLSASVGAAYAAKVPVVTLYGYSADLKDKVAGSVQADLRLCSATLGKWVAQNISDGQVTCIMGLPGRGDAEMYRDAFRAEAEKNTHLKLVASAPGDWNRQKAYSQMQSLIASYPGMKAVFVENDDMALGALKALTEAGKADKVAVLSQNGAPYGLESVAAGGIRITVGWSPSQEAQIALRLLAALVRDGRAPPKLTLSPITVISKDTIGTAVPWEATAASTDATLNMDLSKLQRDFAK